MDCRLSDDQRREGVRCRSFNCRGCSAYFKVDYEVKTADSFNTNTFSDFIATLIRCDGCGCYMNPKGLVLSDNQKNRGHKECVNG